jgi:UDP:flavonoid glycosyltransferase YjiC (YdhE family)
MIAKKSKLLIIPFPLLSHNLRCIQIAEFLKKDYEIAFIGNSKYTPLINKYGFNTIDDYDIEVDSVLSKAESFDFSWINEGTIEKLMLSHLSVIEKYVPDAVIGDAVPSLRITLEYCGVPYISLINNYMSNYYKCARPVPPVHKAFQYQERLPEDVWNKILRFAEKLSMQHVHKPFNSIRKKYKLNTIKGFLEEYEGNLNLLCDDSSIFPLKILPDNYKEIGALFYFDEEEEFEISDFLNENFKRKTILVSTGSSGSKYFDCYNIIVSGKNPPISKENIVYKEFIHVNGIIDRIDLIISHGGNGIIYQALSKGVPHIMIPSFFEQYWNATRIEKLAFGQIHNIFDGIDDLISKIEINILRKNDKELRSISEKLNSNIKNQDKLVLAAVKDFLN